MGKLPNLAVWRYAQSATDSHSEKKIYEHRDSASHKQALSVQQTASADTLKTVVVESQKEHVDATCKVFRTVYYIAANNLCAL